VIPLHDDNPTRRRAVVTVALIAINIAVYFWVQPNGTDVLSQQKAAEFTYEHAAIPCELTTSEPLSIEEIASDTCNEVPEGPPAFPDKNVWLAALVSMFLHGSLLHLGGNMLFLWVFGNNIEDRLGAVRYLAFYLGGGIIATAAHVMLQPSSAVPVIGASGAVAGVMGAYLVLHPNVRIKTLFIFFFIMFRDVSAKWVLGIWFFSQFLTAVNPNSGVAWGAHVGGFVFGLLVGLALKATAARQPSMTGPY
jgi:membrane associated rhomboid family serine protease